ncbi:hypothetical protein NQZ68_023101 [Dissostichus eleginoides]|nr:hypothetical protein NQZ68_023101 [Dissostichus eleginoides]
MYWSTSKSRKKEQKKSFFSPPGRSVNPNQCLVWQRCSSPRHRLTMEASLGRHTSHFQSASSRTGLRAGGRGEAQQSTSNPVPLPLRSAGFIEPSKSVSQWRLAEAEGAIFFTRFLPRRLPPSRLWSPKCFVRDVGKDGEGERDDGSGGVFGAAQGLVVGRFGGPRGVQVGSSKGRLFALLWGVQGSWGQSLLTNTQLLSASNKLTPEETNQSSFINPLCRERTRLKEKAFKKQLRWTK